MKTLLRYFVAIVIGFAAYILIPITFDEIQQFRSEKRVSAANLNVDQIARYAGIASACSVSSLWDGSNVMSLAFDLEWQNSSFKAAFNKGSLEAVHNGCAAADYKFMTDNGLKFMGFGEYNTFREQILDNQSNKKHRTDLKVTPALTEVPFPHENE